MLILVDHEENPQESEDFEAMESDAPDNIEIEAEHEVHIAYK